jgi:hypothetical protein
MNPSFAHFPRRLRKPSFALLLLALVAGPVLAQDEDIGVLLGRAEEAVNRASRADADQYAPDLIGQARQGLAQAQAAASERKGRKEAPWLAERAAVDADLARVRSEEAVANAKLQQQQNEIARLRRQLGLEAEQ